LELTARLVVLSNRVAGAVEAIAVQRWLALQINCAWTTSKLFDTSSSSAVVASALTVDSADGLVTLATVLAATTNAGQNTSRVGETSCSSASGVASVVQIVGSYASTGIVSTSIA
jgi:hypothetical protein